MTTPRVLGFSVLALLAAAACRPREGERCICADDCAGDLVCAADGAELRGNQCVYNVGNDIEAGVCVKGGNANANDDALTPPRKLDAGDWATSGQVPVTAGNESEGETTTMPDETTSSSGGSSSSSAGESSSGTETTSSSSSGSSSSTGASSGETTAGM